MNVQRPLRLLSSWTAATSRWSPRLSHVARPLRGPHADYARVSASTPDCPVLPTCSGCGLHPRQATKERAEALTWPPHRPSHPMCAAWRVHPPATARPPQGTRRHPLLLLFPASDADEAPPADPTPKVWAARPLSCLLSRHLCPGPWITQRAFLRPLHCKCNAFVTLGPAERLETL